MAFPFQSVGLQGPPSGPNPRKSRPQRNRARWFWPTLRQRAPARSAHGRLVFDPLEPRLLLSADVLAVNLAHDTGPQAADHSVIVQMVQDTQQTNAQAVSVQRVQVVDQSNNAVLAFGDINEISAISIVGGAGNDKLTIDAQSFGGHTAPAISFDGGAGQNNVVFDNSGATTWSLTGKDAGTVAGNGVTTTFQNVGNLTGAANNNDTLTVQKGGTLSGTFDGGAGGFDSLVFDNGPHTSVTYTPTGSDSGAIVQDGQTFNFKGLEPISLGAESHVIVDTSATTGGTQSPDPLTTTLQTVGGAFTGGLGDNLVISGTDHNGAAFEYITFHADSAASGLEITLGAADTMQVDSLPDIGKNLTIDGNARRSPSPTASPRPTRSAPPRRQPAGNRSAAPRPPPKASARSASTPTSRWIRASPSRRARFP